MSTSQANKKVKLGDEVPAKAAKLEDDEEDLDFSKYSTETTIKNARKMLHLGVNVDIKGIISAISKFKDKATTDVKHKNETIISSLNSELKDILDEAKNKADKERQTSLRAISKICKDTEGAMKNEMLKFQALHEKFTADMKVHMEACEDLYNKYEEQKEKLILKLDQQRKKDKSLLEDLNKITSQKIADAESSLKKRKQEEKSIDYLRKTLGSFFGDSASEDEPEE